MAHARLAPYAMAADGPVAEPAEAEAPVAQRREGDAGDGGAVAAGELHLEPELARRLPPVRHLRGGQVRRCWLPGKLDVRDLRVHPRGPRAVLRPEQQHALGRVIGEVHNPERGLVHLCRLRRLRCMRLPEGGRVLRQPEERLDLGAVEGIAPLADRLQVGVQRRLSALEVLGAELPHHRLRRQLRHARQPLPQEFVHGSKLVEALPHCPGAALVLHSHRVLDMLPRLDQGYPGLEYVQRLADSPIAAAAVDQFIPLHDRT
mmetsp:Transcript_85992/g.243913  ORF Transcript_85992/g.243913 Transcript_85992/m.243913 type:complete len:261 (+) Transcript_85992:250-1032(+)